MIGENKYKHKDYWVGFKLKGGGKLEMNYFGGEIRIRKPKKKPLPKPG